MAAMAWRVKYRKAGTQGANVKLKQRIEHLCVRPENRGSVYPAGLRCKALCGNVVNAGFAKEEFCHQLVAVEDTPLSTSAVADKTTKVVPHTTRRPAKHTNTFALASTRLTSTRVSCSSRIAICY